MSRVKYVELGIETSIRMRRDDAKRVAELVATWKRLGNPAVTFEQKGTGEEMRAYYEARDAAIEGLDSYLRSAEVQRRLRDAMAVPLLAKFTTFLDLPETKQAEPEVKA
jgi:hypothetical protein